MILPRTLVTMRRLGRNGYGVLYYPLGRARNLLQARFHKTNPRLPARESTHHRTQVITSRARFVNSRINATLPSALTTCPFPMFPAPPALVVLLIERLKSVVV